MKLMEYLRPKIVETLESIKWKTQVGRSGPDGIIPGIVQFYNCTQDMHNSFTVELSDSEIKKAWSMFNVARTIGLSSTRIDVGRFVGIILSGMSTEPNAVTFRFDYMLEEEHEEEVQKSKDKRIVLYYQTVVKDAGEFPVYGEVVYTIIPTPTEEEARKIEDRDNFWRWYIPLDKQLERGLTVKEFDNFCKCK